MESIQGLAAEAGPHTLSAMEPSESHDQPLDNLEEKSGIVEKNIGKKRKRVRGVNCRAQNKLLRMKGLPYLGLQRNLSLDENSAEGSNHIVKAAQNVPRKGRALGPPCDLHNTGKSYFQCRQFSEEIRQKYFNSFWENMNWDDRKILIKSLVECKPVKGHRKKGSNRTEAPVYYLKTEDGTKLRVCKPFFLSTFSLGKRMVDGWFKDPKVPDPPFKVDMPPRPVEIEIDTKDKKLRNKILRMKGLPYLGLQRNSIPTDGEKKYCLGIPREGRVMGPHCELHTSSKSSFQCHEFPDHIRRRYFDYFWQDLNWDQRKTYVRSLVEIKPVKTHRAGGDPIRHDVVYYHLKSPDDGTLLLRVCKPFFISTFGVGKHMVDHWCKKSPKIESSQKDATSDVSIQFTQHFFSLLPKNYCQKSLSKLFLEPMITAKIQLYRIYKDFCENSSQPTISITKFKSVFEELNLSLFSPKKDLCDLCEKYKDGEVGEDVYKAHQMKKERAMSEKKFDKEQCVKGTYNGVTVDLQTVKQAPFLPLQSSIYFKAKLNVYSYTVYNLGNDKVRCYWWDETQGDLVASSFVSCLVDYLETFNSDYRPIVVFSDGCGYQNRNIVMSNALLNFAMRRHKIIYQKFIDKEHSQTECDSVHADIDRKLKDMNIGLPRDYMEVCRSARRHPTSRYEAKEIDYSFFRDYTSKFFQRYESIRPGSKPKDPHETDIQALKYDPNGQIFFKIHFDDVWRPLPRKPKQLVTQETAPPLFGCPIKLDFKKYSDLQDLKQLLPTECHQFYDNLTYEPYQVPPTEYPAPEIPPASSTSKLPHESVQVELRDPGESTQGDLCHAYESLFVQGESKSLEVSKSAEAVDSIQSTVTQTFQPTKVEPELASDVSFYPGTAVELFNLAQHSGYL
ncbi:unnamed protein product [Allacma fusca]|uniref:Uncharacterized protein n=1 Tax=Allacma fusca TaxID=39272 RepID=A0A8J2P2J6_9HEXA|nr:unnamed protein product [Allacma fusca]